MSSSFRVPPSVYAPGGAWCQTRGFVYFIRCGERGPIKIGVAKNPYVRLNNLQSSNPEKLSLLRTIPSTDPHADERRLHEIFEDVRVRGEWFSPNPVLLALAKSEHVPSWWHLPDQERKKAA